MDYSLNYIIEEIKKNLPILEVAEEFGLKVKRASRSHMILCPVHTENTPSCSLVPHADSTKDYFHCFGCEAGGDQIRLFSILNNITNGQAIHLLAKRFGLSTDKPLPEPLVRQYAKNKRNRAVEKNFLEAYKLVYNDLCCIPFLLEGLISQYDCIEQLVMDDLIIMYYHRKEELHKLVDSLYKGLVEEIDFDQQVEAFIKAKGVVEEWARLLQKR